MRDRRENRICPNGTARDVVTALEPVRRARNEIERDRVGRQRIVEHLKLLAPGFAPRPERLVFSAGDRKFEVDRLQCARRPIEEDAAPDHRQAGGPPAGEKSHSVEFC